MSMQAASGAVILAFPARGAAAGRARLQLATEGLIRALDEQRQAMREWRAALDQLSAASSGLHGSLRAHERALAGLAARVASLGEQANRMTAWSETLPAL